MQLVGMWESSIIVVINDNGGAKEPHGSNYPMAGSKGSVFQGGVRTQGFIYSPGFLPKAGGRSLQGIMHIVDWLPTILSACGGAPRSELPLDGVNVWPAIVSESALPARTTALLYVDSKSSAFIADGKKIVFGPRAVTNSADDIPMGGPVDVRCIPSTFDGRRDCSTTACIFNISMDPCERWDISTIDHVGLQDLVTKRNEVLASINWPIPEAVVHKSLDKCEGIDSRGEWSPWLSSFVPFSGTVVLASTSTVQCDHWCYETCARQCDAAGIISCIGFQLDTSEPAGSFECNLVIAADDDILFTTQTTDSASIPGSTSSNVLMFPSSYSPSKTSNDLPPAASGFVLAVSGSGTSNPSKFITTFDRASWVTDLLPADQAFSVCIIQPECVAVVVWIKNAGNGDMVSVGLRSTGGTLSKTTSISRGYRKINDSVDSGTTILSTTSIASMRSVGSVSNSGELPVAPQGFVIVASGVGSKNPRRFGSAFDKTSRVTEMLPPDEGFEVCRKLITCVALFVWRIGGSHGKTMSVGLDTVGTHTPKTTSVSKSYIKFSDGVNNSASTTPITRPAITSSNDLPVAPPRYTLFASGSGSVDPRRFSTAFEKSSRITSELPPDEGFLACDHLPQCTGVFVWVKGTTITSIGLSSIGFTPKGTKTISRSYVKSGYKIPAPPAVEAILSGELPRAAPGFQLLASGIGTKNPSRFSSAFEKSNRVTAILPPDDGFAACAILSECVAMFVWTRFNGTGQTVSVGLKSISAGMTSTTTVSRSYLKLKKDVAPSCARVCGSSVTFVDATEPGRPPTRCYCDSGCIKAGDCCPDYAELCMPSSTSPRWVYLRRQSTK